jgi:hypothetical protein
MAIFNSYVSLPEGTTFLGYLALGDSSKVDVFVRMHRVLVLLGV